MMRFSIGIAKNKYEHSIEARHSAKTQMLDTYNMLEFIAQLCDGLNANLPKKEVTINPCHSSENLINFWRYSIGRKWYELKWRLFK